MRIADLLQHWHQPGAGRAVPGDALVLAPHDAARVEALHCMYPHRNEAELIADLVHAALDELELAMPVVRGQRILAEDDAGTPIHEDLGPAPRYYCLSFAILRRLLAQGGQAAASPESRMAPGHAVG